VDCDSFQLEANGKIYLCEVGVPIFTPPELQGHSLKVRRTVNHDCFGLAVLLFNLLFMGRHPFAGRFTGRGDMPIERAIAESRFAYVNSHTLQMLAPPGALTLAEVGNSLSGLFERAFVSKNRPLPKEWVSALHALESTLKRCDKNGSHWFPNVGPCPWCRIETETGIALFAIVTINLQGRDVVVEVTRLWSAIEAIAPLPPAAFPAMLAAQPSTEAIRAGKVHRKKVRLAAILWFSPMVGGLALLASDAPGLGVLLILIDLIIGFNRIGKIRNEARSKLHQELQEKEPLLRVQRKEWDTIESAISFNGLRTKAYDLKQELMSLPNQRTARLAKLENDKRKQQLEEFLDKFSISDAGIPGIGRGRVALLRAEQIITAADISPYKRVPGFGQVYMGRLLQWRGQVESKFVFDPKRSIDPRLIAQVENDHRLHVERLRSTLMRVPSELQKLNQERASKREAVRMTVIPLVNRIAQIQADLKVC
jgi:DNA-binding helix-hairpin-helix protein with protein kinase domain